MSRIGTLVVGIWLAGSAPAAAEIMVGINGGFVIPDRRRDGRGDPGLVVRHRPPAAPTVDAGRAPTVEVVTPMAPREHRSTAGHCRCRLVASASSSPPSRGARRSRAAPRAWDGRIGGHTSDTSVSSARHPYSPGSPPPVARQRERADTPCPRGRG